MAAIVAAVCTTMVAWWNLGLPRLVLSPELSRIAPGLRCSSSSTATPGANPLGALQVGGTNAIPSATTNAAIGNWNHTTDRNWHGYIDFIYLWDRVLDLCARRAIRNNPYQLVKPRLSARTYVAYGITAPGPPLGDSGKGSIVIAITS